MTSQPSGRRRQCIASIFTTGGDETSVACGENWNECGNCGPSGDSTLQPESAPGAAAALLQRVSVDQPEGARPAGLGKKMGDYIDYVVDADVAVGEIRRGRF